MAQGKQLVRALFLVMVVLFALPARSQQKDPRVNQPVQPLPGVSSGESSSKTSPNAAGDQANAMKPDTRPLSGAEQFSLGSMGDRNFFFMSAHFREDAENADFGGGGNSGDWNAVTLVSGDIGVKHAWSRSELTATYAGGGTLYNTGTTLNQSYHKLGLSEKILFRRWTLLLTDEASYLPESSFGFSGLGLPGGVGGLGGFGGQFSNLNPLFNPSQSILTGQARRVSNTFVGEADYAISPRSSFTASGSYGILRFVDDGFIDNTSIMFNGGYNYELSSRNTLGVIYGFTRFDFIGLDNGLQTHVAQLAYGRRITGRLALQLNAGPSFTHFANPAARGIASWQTSWNAGALLRYQMPRGGVSLNYIHGVSGGSGVFSGSTRDEIQTVADRKLARNLSGSLNFGYARNAGLGQSLVSGAAVPNGFRFDSWTAGATVTRTLSRRTNVYFNYRMERQNSTQSVCVSAVCGTTFLRHQFGLGVNWSLRPSESR